MTTILQRYAIKELIAPVFLSALFFTFMMLLNQIFSMAGILLEANVHWTVFFEILGILSISLLALTIPMAALLGCIVGIGRLTADNEILAIRCAGIKLSKIFMPVFVLAFLGSLGLMFLGFETLPRLYRHLDNQQTEFQFQILTNLDSGRAYTNLSPEGSDVYLYYDERAPAEESDGPYHLRMNRVAMRIFGHVGRLTDAEINTETSERNETLYFSNRGTIVGDLDTRTVTLTLEDGLVMPVNRENRDSEIVVGFDQMQTAMTPQSDEDRIDRTDPRILSFSEIRDVVEDPPESNMYHDPERRNLTRAWRFFLNVRNEYYQRMTLPFSLLAFVLIAVPLAVELRPRAKVVSIGISLGLLVVYYAMLTYAGALGMSYSPFTFAAYLAPNVLIGGIGIYLFWRVQR